MTSEQFKWVEQLKEQSADIKELKRGFRTLEEKILPVYEEHLKKRILKRLFIFGYLFCSPAIWYVIFMYLEHVLYWKSDLYEPWYAIILTVVLGGLLYLLF